MTQYKLVPMEPTPEMVESAFGAINYTMPEPSEDAGRVYSAMLSAAPSPAGDEVERVARAINPRAWEVMDHELHKTQEKYAGQRVSWPVSQFQHKESMDQARAALSAMRPAPSPGEKVIQGLEEAVRYSDKDEQDIMQKALVRSVKVVSHPAPKLTEEDGGRVEALLREALDYTGQRYAPIDTEACNEYARLCDAAHDKVREALALIDKLTEAG